MKGVVIFSRTTLCPHVLCALGLSSFLLFLELKDPVGFCVFALKQVPKAPRASCPQSAPPVGGALPQALESQPRHVAALFQKLLVPHCLPCRLSTSVCGIRGSPQSGLSTSPSATPRVQRRSLLSPGFHGPAPLLTPFSQRRMLFSRPFPLQSLPFLPDPAGVSPDPEPRLFPGAQVVALPCVHQRDLPVSAT